MVELPVPEWVYARKQGVPHLLFGSRLIEGYRDLEPWLRANLISNRLDLAKMIAFDVWIANNDRNMGNIIGDANKYNKEEGIKAVAIDFERSKVLRGKTPVMETSNILPSSLWPCETLGRLLAGEPEPDAQWLNRVTNLDKDDIIQAIGVVQRSLGLPADWCVSTSNLLVQRVRNLTNLVAEVWRCRPNIAS